MKEIFGETCNLENTNQESIESLHKYTLIPWDISVPLKTFELTNNTFNELHSHSSTSVLVRRWGEQHITIIAYGENEPSTLEPNIRATTLAMACGIYAKRLYGDVILQKKVGFQQLIVDCCHHDFLYACMTPDLRIDIIANIFHKKNKTCPTSSEIQVPDFILEALGHNYRDHAAFSQVAKAMKLKSGTSLIFEKNEFILSQSAPVCDLQVGSNAEDHKNDNQSASTFESPPTEAKLIEPEKLLKQETKNAPILDTRLQCNTLCLHCRRPATKLCSSCKGAYFCDISSRCPKSAWSHECTCPTWDLYVARREELQDFDFLQWSKKLTLPSFQTSESPYREFLREELGVEGRGWWLTELEGWAAGMGPTSRLVDLSIRRTYEEGFVNLPAAHVPKEESVNFDFAFSSGVYTDEQGMLNLKSWKDYYTIRNIPQDSVVALLMSFPLTLYFAIQRYGMVPLTVSKMLKRPLRIHVVGVEKELNFLEIFCELAYLMPNDIKINLLFIVRKDMLPPLTRSTIDSHVIKFSEGAVTMSIVGGTYGQDLNPDFDCGGMPDMVVGFNAGLFAYESWNCVISYLDSHPSVIGVFSDYNEWSGVNCASLGGKNARNSICINPFRQPRSMPVYCMNLPQMSNAFLYVYNQQVLE